MFDFDFFLIHQAHRRPTVIQNSIRDLRLFQVKIIPVLQSPIDVLAKEGPRLGYAMQPVKMAQVDGPGARPIRSGIMARREHDPLVDVKSGYNSIIGSLGVCTARTGTTGG
jgi:hypothetical protein